MEAQEKRKVIGLIGTMNELKYDIKAMLDWSDRIGSDERYQLHQLISTINRSLRDAK